jgi:GT2 family glycosyltransferase
MSTSSYTEQVTTLTVVIPATDGRTTLDRTIGAIRRASGPPEELIVIDKPDHLGPAAARNLGSRRAGGDVLVFVDADVEVHPDAFDRIRSAFDGDEGLAAVFGSYDDDPAPGGVVSDFRNLLHHHVHQEGAGVATTFWAGLGAIRRDVFLALGGFDEERFPRPSVEDIELGMRLHVQGSRIVLDPAVQGKHLKRWTLASMAKTDLLRRGVPWLRLVIEYRTGSTALNLGWRHRIGTAASLLLLLGLLRRNAWLVGSTLALLIVLDRRGARLVAASVPLHIVHRLASAAAVPIAVTNHLFLKARGSFDR